MSISYTYQTIINEHHCGFVLDLNPSHPGKSQPLDPSTSPTSLHTCMDTYMDKGRETALPL